MMVGRPQQPDPWGLAFDLLSPEEQSTIQRYPTKSSPTAKDYTVVEAILQAVQDKRKLCMQKRWTFTTISGRRIIIRDVLDKIAIWVNRFKEVGDTLVQYDPHHAAFPWAGIRFLLQASVNDLENFTIMAERLETVARLTARYSVFEAVYLSPDRGTPSPAQVKLLEALTGLYAECLRHLVDIGKYYDRPAKERIAQSIFGASSQKSSNNRLQSIATKEEEVEKLGQIIQAERAVHMSSAITTLDEKSQQSFQSLEALLQSLTAPVLRLSDPLTLLQDTLQEEERRKFLLWLSGYNYRQYHESSYKEIVRNTCQWIFFKTEYQEWQRSSVSSILWLHGIPGCGKTKLTSSVIQQHLDQAQKNKQNAPVAYVYCSSVSTSSKTMQMNATAILQTILKQLATSASTQTIRRPVWEEYKRRQEAAKMDGLDPSPLIADECVELLKTLMLDSPATIIIDGLDELEMQRFDLIMALKTLITESPNVVKIMISSREEVDIAQELRDSISICASAIENSADIDLFVKEKVNLAITNRRLLRGSVSEDLKNHLMRTLLDGANGMFLWPAMQLEYLSDHNKFKVEADIVTALENLPPTLFKTFDCLYKRIEECKYHSKGAATRALAWLLAAERTLSVSELMTAIRENVEDETLGTTKKTDHVYDAQKILDLCCNFVMLDTNTKKFSFVHASVRDYLLQLPEYSVSAINSLVAGRCLAYFMFDDDERVSESWSNEDETGDHGLPESSFREYAICHWAHHLLKVTDDEAKSKLDIVLKNFVSEEETMTFQQWLEDVKELVELKTPNRLKESHRTELNTILNDSSSPLFVACVYGLPSILEQMEAEISGSGRSIDYSATNLNGTPAVYISARYGRAAILQHLLEHGANVDEAGGFFGNPLQAAAFHGYLDVVKILMDWGANLSASGKFISALEAAMSGGNEKVIGALLKASNITQKDELEKVLLRVSYDGHNEIVANILGLLYPNEPGTLTRGTSANLHDTLQVALFQCRPRIVRRLLKDTIPDINMNTGHFGNALQAAAFGGHATMVVLVLEHGADINSRGRYGTALRAAALRGHDTIVKLLVDRGASIEGKDADAIAAAAFNGHFSTVQYLVSCGVYDVDQFSQMEPAVEAACFRGYIDVARLFLQTYHCKEHAKKCAQTVFSSALNGGRENIVRLALEYDPSIRDSDRPYVGLVPCGVNKGLSLLPDEHSSYRGDTKSPHQPPTQHEENNSAYAKFDTRLPWRSIDKQSAPISSEEQRHAMTANEDIGKGNGRFLRIAARNGFVGTLQHLLDQGNDINTTGDALHSNQPTPIEVASAAGQTQVVEFLLVKKAKVGKALSYAVSNQHPAVIEMLLQHLPDLALDDPVRLGEVGHRERSTSAIAVAVAWNFPDMLAILLKHGKKIQCSTIGSGLVVAVETGYINLLRSILCDFQLKDVGDEDSASNAREYRAFVAAVTMAARKRNISALQVLMDHVPLTTLKEQFLSRFITEGIAQEWYGSLQAIKTAFAPPFYDRLAGKALIAMAAVDRRRRGRKGADRDKTILFDEINRLSEISPISSCSAREALIEASKNFNLEIIHFLFGQHSEYHCRIQDPVVSWINLPNADGHTALYHACVTGCLKVFRDLVQAGASLYTTHAPYPMQFFSADGERVDNQRPTEVNLVQVAVDGCLASRWWRNSYTIWEEPLRDNWGPIVCALLNAGLKVDLKSVSLRTFFYISCFQGELLYVERLLKEGISLVGPSGKTEDRDLHFDSALHAAVVGGQRAVVDCLLSHGADVHYKAESKKRKNQTVVEACMKDRNFFKKKTESLQICAYLVHVGGDEADAEAVLVKACETDNVEIVKQMLHRGTRIENFPINASVDVFDAFVDAGYDFHSQLSFIAELQVRAIQEGNVALLSNLVEKYDLQHRFDMFSDCGWAIIRCEGDRAPVLRYLINKCSFDISTVYPSYAESSKMVNLLYQAACFAMNAEVVEFLLKEGADPDPPGFLFTPLTYCFKSHSSAIFPVVKTLLDFGADVNGSRKEDRELDGRLKPEFDRKPLVQAIHQGLLEVVELLIEKGADINHGQIPPLRLARVYERREIEDLLLRHGAVDNSDPTLSVTEYIMGIWTAMEK